MWKEVVLYTIDGMDLDAKNYEFAYLLSPSLPEEDVLGVAGKISELIEEHKGAIRRVEPPKKRRLAYTVNKEHSAYFGWTTFAGLPSAIAVIGKKAKERPEILRHLIVEEEIETRRPILRSYVPGTSGASRPPSGTGAQRPEVLREQEVAGEKLDFEALDKKLEEILGK